MDFQFATRAISLLVLARPSSFVLGGEDPFVLDLRCTAERSLSDEHPPTIAERLSGPADGDWCDGLYYSAPGGQELPPFTCCNIDGLSSMQEITRSAVDFKRRLVADGVPFLASADERLTATEKQWKLQFGEEGGRSQQEFGRACYSARTRVMRHRYDALVMAVQLLDRGISALERLARGVGCAKCFPRREKAAGGTEVEEWLSSAFGGAGGGVAELRAVFEGQSAIAVQLRGRDEEVLRGQGAVCLLGYSLALQYGSWLEQLPGEISSAYTSGFRTKFPPIPMHSSKMSVLWEMGGGWDCEGSSWA